MSIKKKLLIALLSTTCVAAGALGLAACKDGPDKKPNPPGPSDTDSGYSVTAVDQDNNPIEGVVFRIGYYDSKTYSDKYVQVNNKDLTATTGADGKASFKGFTPQEGIQYSVFIADSSNGRSYPYGYGTEVYSVEFDEQLHATYEFKYLPSSFIHNPTHHLDYKRVFDKTNYDGVDASTMQYVEEGSKELTLNIKKGVHSYFEFLSYKEIGEGDNEAGGQQGSEYADFNQYWNTIAAAGVYKIAFTSSTPVTMYNFYSNGGYVSADDNGIPYPIESVDGTTGFITLELTAYGYYSRASKYFGIYSESDCTVTVSVERTGDAEEPEQVTPTIVQAPADLGQFGEQSGTLTLMSVDGSLKTVLGSDGYYHVGSKTGPVLLLQLNNALPRVSTAAISKLPEQKPTENDKPLGDAALTFSIYEDEKLTGIFNYANVIAAYSAKANADGVYGVDETLYNFLQHYATQGQMTESQSAGEYAWLLPCQFYLPEGGMVANGTGTQQDPYALLTTKNILNLSGTQAYAQFTANTSGIYTFAYTGCTVTVSGEKNSFVDGGLLHVCLAANETVTFTVSGSGEATITVTNLTETEGNVIAEAVDADEESKGMNESNSIRILVGYNAYVVDSSIADGVWVNVTPFSTGTCTLVVKGSSNVKLEYGGHTYGEGETLTIEATGGQKYSLYLTAKDNDGNVVNGVYAIEWNVTI